MDLVSAVPKRIERIATIDPPYRNVLTSYVLLTIYIQFLGEGSLVPAWRGGHEFVVNKFQGHGDGDWFLSLER